MNVKNWTKSHKKGIIIAIAFLVIGLIISPKGVEVKEVVNTEYKEVVITEYVDECKGFGIYKQIKAVDDEIILTQALGLALASEGFGAVSTLDFDELDRINKQVVILTPYLEKLRRQRTNLIEKLGE